MTRTLTLGLIVLTWSANPACADSASAATTVTRDELREHVATLASEAYDGRGAGTAGGRKAADYIAAEFKRLGLKGGGDAGGFFQSFKHKTRELRNVIGVLPGSDRAREAVVIGAHYDHLGHGEYGSLDFGGSKGIHNGADDNASGTAGILELAEAFVEGGLKPRRTIIFILFDGEELGLLGSKHYAENPHHALSETTAMINMDMIGRLGAKPLVVYGAVTGGPALAAEINRAAELVNLKLDVKDVMTPNSDHYSFYAKQVPSIALFTGLHGDYHRPGDDVEKIDQEGMEKIVRFATYLTFELAQGEATLAFAKAKEGGVEMIIEQLKAMFGDRFDLKKLFGEGFDPKSMDPRKFLEELGKRFRPNRPSDRKPRFGVRLGEFEGEEGVGVVEVVAGTIAERSGVKEGDRILSFDGQKVSQVRELVEAVGRAQGKVAIVVARGTETLTIQADFGGEPKDSKKPRLY